MRLLLAVGARRRSTIPLGALIAPELVVTLTDLAAAV